MTNAMSDKSTEGQAGAIEITPEMIEAGASVLYRMETAFAREEIWAEEVYRAMASLAPAAHVPSVSTFASSRGAPSS